MKKNDVIEILSKYGIEIALDGNYTEKTINRGNRTIEIRVHGSYRTPENDYNVSVYAHEGNWTITNDCNYGRAKVESYLYTAFNERYDVLNRFKTAFVEFLNANPCEVCYLKATPTDSVNRVRVNDKILAAHDAYRYMSPEYRDHVIGFKLENRDVLPILEGEWDKRFWDEKSEYIAKKAAWCDKYGCE